MLPRCQTHSMVIGSAPLGMPHKEAPLVFPLPCPAGRGWSCICIGIFADVPKYSLEPRVDLFTKFSPCLSRVKNTAQGGLQIINILQRKTIKIVKQHNLKHP